MSDATTDQVFTNAERGITASKVNRIVSTLKISPDFVDAKPATANVDPGDELLILKTNKQYAKALFSMFSASVANTLPIADTVNNGMLRKVSGLTTDFIDGTNNSQDLGAAIRILGNRSYNAIGNPNNECDQRQTGAALTNPASGTFVQDRWLVARVGSMAANFQRVAVPSGVIIPGSNYAITGVLMRVTLTTVQASLGALDCYLINQPLEGTNLRPLIGDVHSASILVRTSVAGLKFGMTIRDPGTPTKSLVKLCTVPSASTWTLIKQPNIPIIPSGTGNFSILPGANGYSFGITLAAGASYMAPANDTWQNGNFVGAVGQSNFMNQLVGSTFEIAFVQHEPGKVCSNFIDIPFNDNLLACSRYYAKSLQYSIKYGPYAAVNQLGQFVSGTTVRCSQRFPVEMAKIPTCKVSGSSNPNSVFLEGIGEVAVSSMSPTTKGIAAITLSAAPPVSANLAPVSGQWEADTGL